MLEQVADVLRAARRALFVTGAGVSADSGLPTYRGMGGLYDGVETPHGRPIEDILSGRTFQRDPELVWRYLGEVERACRSAKPNAAHRVIAALQDRMEVVVLTQNVDGLHLDAGSREVIEIHGTLRRLRCRCGAREEEVDYSRRRVPPRCAACERIMRPDVVLFGEMLPPGALQALRVHSDRGFDVVFSVGTSSLFPYISAPVLDAARRRVPTVEINPGDTELSARVAFHLRGRAAPTMTAIARLLGE